jgi:sulfopyruvate decarboxylase subunit beta
MIDQVEMMKTIDKLRGDAVVVPVFRANIAWSRVTSNVRRDIPVGGAMGKASSVALGLALAQPNTKVILFDGDGSLLMNLGSLVTIANQSPKNLYHFVMDNGVYATTGGQDVPGAGLASYGEMARALATPTPTSLITWKILLPGRKRSLIRRGRCWYRPRLSRISAYPMNGPL